MEAVVSREGDGIHNASTFGVEEHPATTAETRREKRVRDRIGRTQNTNKASDGHPSYETEPVARIHQ
jgi:hypothetical protein